ncbi:DUF2909 domain-containing protein [Corallincola platygyrae]|uniref:DUF2909 domain-containing protein n=1 Tax=Corallincola platygyrae TaxID=1193278 RepID=A0ABW4XMI6_9GAMM
MSMIFKGIILVLLGFVVFNLFSGLAAMLKPENKRPMSHFLGKRVFFSAAVIVLLLLLMASGLIPMNPRPY